MLLCATSPVFVFPDTLGNETVVVATWLRRNPIYVNVITWFNFIFMGLGPFILLISLNVLILIQLRHSRSPLNLAGISNDTSFSSKTPHQREARHVS